jgi:hypothetical protein
MPDTSAEDAHHRRSRRSWDGTNRRRLALPVDGKFWITDEAKNERDWMPEEWAATQSVGAGSITITVELSTDREELTASLADRSVIYRPQTPNDPVVFCA